MSPRQQTVALTSFIFANIIAGFDGTMVSTALPAITSSLHGLTLMSWIVTIYLLLMAVSTPIWMKLAERFGYKQLFLLGTAILTVSSLLQGFSGSMVFLIIMRGIMGLGAGAVMTIPFTIVGHLLPVDRRRAFFGNLVVGYTAAAVIGPLLGGLLVDTLGWRWVFFVNVPMGLAMFVLIAFNLKMAQDLKKIKIDSLGAASLSLAMIVFMLAMQFMGTIAPNWAEIAGLLVIAILAFLLFLRAESRAADPIVPMEFLRNHPMMMKNLVMFLEYGFFSFYNTYLPTWSQGVMGANATIGGLVLIPSALAMAIGSRFANPLLRRFGEKVTITFASSLLLVADLGLILLPKGAPIAWLFIFGTLIGFASPLFGTIIPVSIQESVPKEQLGAATALNILIRSLGMTLVVAALSISLNQTFTSAVKSDSRLTINLLNLISNSQAAKSIPSNLITPLRQVLFDGMHNLALICGAVLVLVLILSLVTKWETKKN